MKKSLFAATLTAAAVLMMGACNKHSWDSTKKIYTHDHDEHVDGDHDHKKGYGDEAHAKDEEK